MIIDFHTHVFPEKIADKTIAHLELNGGIKAFTNGTLEGLKDSMKHAKVDLSVVLPVVTKPSQFESVNKYAAKINGKEGIISFGGIHPHSENYIVELDTIKSLGLLGIKLHPDYQDTFIDDERYVRIINYAMSLGLVISIHAGLDIGLPDPVHCTPKRVLRLLEQVDPGNNRNSKLVMAHTGGYAYWEEVENLIAGKNLYLDVSYSLEFMDQAQFERIVQKHGADHVLFATDSPWSGQKETIERLQKTNLSQEELDQIFYLNAKVLLGI